MAFSKKTKIVCTMGPATESDDVLRSLIENGMNVARFNFSHGSHDYHRKNIERLKAGTESKIYIWKPRHVKVDPEEAKDKGANK